MQPRAFADILSAAPASPPGREDSCKARLSTVGRPLTHQPCHGVCSGDHGRSTVTGSLSLFLGNCLRLGSCISQMACLGAVAEMCQRTGLEPTEALPYPRSWRALRPACRSPQGLLSMPAAHLNIIPWPAMPIVSTLIISDHCYLLLLCPHGPPSHTSALQPNSVPLYELWLDSPLCPVLPTPTTSSSSLSPWP